MNEKVKLTQEQADAIELAKERYGSNQFIYDYSKMLHDISPVKYTGKLDPVNDLALHELAKVLYIGYEVEPEFKAGDWVIRDDHKTIGVVTLTDNHYIVCDGGHSGLTTYFRHATPVEIATEKTRRWWESHGRNVNEYREGDLVREGDVANIETVLVASGYLETDYSRYVCDEINDIRIVTFVEDRKDIKQEETK